MDRKLTNIVTFRKCSQIANRIAVPPMLTYSGLNEGFVSEDTINYYKARSNAAGMIIVEYIYVQRDGGPNISLDYPEQLALYSDGHMEGMQKLVQGIQKDGNKAILQIQHGGRRAIGRYQKGEKVYAPSETDFSSIDYPVEVMTDEYIWELIKNFGRATQLAIDIGADGVEIHGASHYLMQQFFSQYSNRRNDFWGGSLEKRMNFPLETVKEITKVVKENKTKEFIVGYRISPEEIHGENFGYDYKEAIKLAQALSQENIDYIHLPPASGFKVSPDGEDASYQELFREALNEEIILISNGGIQTEKQAQEALKHADIIAIGRGTIIDPDFGLKIMEGRGDEIVSEISPAQLEKSQLTPGLVEIFSDSSNAFGIPMLSGYKSITHLHKGWARNSD
ncbi:hypothetical protein [Peribacillus simplex]|uniref:oxidoreductase n=1 Tax=Peribacillus simplex TaxID=1478 RepID=UPI00333B1265